MSTTGLYRVYQMHPPCLLQVFTMSATGVYDVYHRRLTCYSLYLLCTAQL